MTDLTTNFDKIKDLFTGNSSENNTLENTNEVNIETPNVFSNDVLRVNLKDYSIKQSMAHKGDSKALLNLFNEIRCGHLIDESADFEYQEKHRYALDDQIIDLEKTSEELLGEQKKVSEVSIPNLKKMILDLEDAIHQWRLKEKQSHKSDTMNRFTLWKYGIMLGLGLIYILAFYISCVYMGMVRNPMEEAQLLNQSGGSANSLFGAIFSRRAFGVLDFHWVSPILILMFAFVLDYLIHELKGHKRIASIVVLICITFILDGFIAYKIENTNFEMKKLMGIDDVSHRWYASSDFYIVLIMGFVATLIWSVLLIAFKQELGKTDFSKVVALEVEFLQKKISDIKNQMEVLELELVDNSTKIKKIALEIKKLRERKRDLKISIPELERYITKFYDGWMQVVAIMPQNYEIKQACEKMNEEFRDTYISDNRLLLDTNQGELETGSRGGQFYVNEYGKKIYFSNT
jgi:ABC-type Fe3+-siderophore transport system permease subunit